jgi:hypothetical protein
MELAKATLQVISPDNPPRELSPAVPVQFNPTTLRLALANQASGGNSRGQQVRQFTGTSSTTLSLDLIFDTADQGTTEQPRSVRELTGAVEKFVLPQGEGKNKQAPPKVRFHWGELIIDGLVESVNVDFDHFAANGTPLRAKVGLQIKEQDSRYMYLESGAGANASSNAPTPGSPSAATPGSSGGGGDQSALALAGESVADFAARVGLDPAAWRGLAAGLDASLSLEAGIELGFSASLNAGVGIGVSLGVQAGASASLETSLGLDVEASAASGARAVATQNAGLTLSAAGGLGAAVESAKIANAQSAVEDTRSAFQQSTTSSSRSASTVQTGLPHQSRTPLSMSTGEGTRPAPAPPRADPRAASYAFGVPLRSTVGAAALIRAGAMQGSLALNSRSSTSAGEPPETFDPTVPKWIALPDDAANTTQRSRGRRPLSACGCSPGCGHK